VFLYDDSRPPPRAPAPEFSDAGSEEEHMHISALYESVTNSIIADLERGVASWVKPWKSGNTGGILPMNAATKRSYNGINIPILWHAQLSRGYPTASWMTYRQAVELGAQVRRPLWARHADNRPITVRNAVVTVAEATHQFVSKVTSGRRCAKPSQPHFPPSLASHTRAKHWCPSFDCSK